MNNERLAQRIEKLERALSRFKEILEDPALATNDRIQDGAVQRFEFSFELYWKTLKRVLEKVGIEEAAGPRDTLTQSFQAEIIGQENVWLNMLKNRNLMSHVYDGEQALEVVSQLPGYYKVMIEELEKVKKRFLDS